MNATNVAIVAAAIGGGVAALISAGFTFWSAYLQRQHEQARQIRELAVQVAMENWKIYMERTKGTKLERLPLVGDMDMFLIHTMYLISAMDGSLKTSEQIRQHLRSTFAAGDAADEEIKKHRKI